MKQNSPECPWIIESLNKYHIREHFDCGEEPLNIFLKTQARKQQERFVGRTFVATLESSPKKIFGFYTLSAGSIHFDSLPIDLRVPKYPLPIARIGRLAVDKTAQGKKLGEYLLWHALTKCTLVAADQMGIVAIIVDAKNDRSKAFYEKYGFIPLKNESLTLIIPIKTVIRAIS